MNLELIRKTWDEKARQTPIGSMLPAEMGHIRSIDQLFAQGAQDIDAAMERVKLMRPPLKRGRALDFGCGLGRTTQALAGHFDEVVGVDISRPFIDLATEYNRHGARCRYVVNERDDLRMFSDDSFDLVWCYGVFHVLENSLVEKYVAEFFRVAAPGGLVVFHQTDRPGGTLKGSVLRASPRPLLNRWYYQRRYGFKVYGMRRERVTALVESNGGHLVHIDPESKTPGRNWLSYQYYARSKAALRSDE